MEHPFPIGTVVWLKSGGPALTVSDRFYPKPELVDLEWFKGDELCRDVIHRDCLTTSNPLMPREASNG